MKELPILMSAPMVRAILAGTKTQTRRIVKPQPHPYESWVGNGWMHEAERPLPTPKVRIQVCPFGEPGNFMWVRETFFPRVCNTAAVYRADCDDSGLAAMYGGWKPSIFMPRWASRITLEIVSVRVERLQDISEDGAKAEGVPPYAPDDGRYVEGYKELWESINGDNSWQLNPWLFVITFKRR